MKTIDKDARTKCSKCSQAFRTILGNCPYCEAFPHNLLIAPKDWVTAINISMAKVFGDKK